MSWRWPGQTLPKYFSVGFNDADPVLNNRLHEDQVSLQFLNPNQEALIAIEKTETQGDLYDMVLYGDQAVSFPRPFVFSLMPMEGHPNADAAKASLAICLYDNAGESFLPGEDMPPARSRGTWCCPGRRCSSSIRTQDMRYRKLCSGKTRDPQMMGCKGTLAAGTGLRCGRRPSSPRLPRLRRFAGLGQSQKHQRPLIVAATKFDSWKHLLAGTNVAGRPRRQPGGQPLRGQPRRR